MHPPSRRIASASFNFLQSDYTRAVLQELCGKPGTAVPITFRRSPATTRSARAVRRSISNCRTPLKPSPNQRRQRQHRHHKLQGKGHRYARQPRRTSSHSRSSQTPKKAKPSTEPSWKTLTTASGFPLCPPPPQSILHPANGRCKANKIMTQLPHAYTPPDPLMEGL